MESETFSAKAIEQFRSALKESTQGTWSCVQLDSEWGIMVNGQLIAKGLSLSDAYLIDAIHGHFGLLIDALEAMRTEVERLRETEMNHNLEAGTAEALSRWQNAEIERLRSLNAAMTSELDKQG